MYRRHVLQLQPGQVLARAIYNEHGEVLLGAGVVLTNGYISRLRQRGVMSAFLKDGLGDDIVPDDIVSEELRATTVTHLARAFDVISTMGHGSRLNAPERPRTVDDLVYRLGERPLDLPSEGISSLQSLYQDVESLINEVLESNTLASLESLKSHNDYTFQHSVDVAVVGILLGRTAGLPRDQLRELALGCLLHDLGKIYIDEAILDKPGKLTPEEFDEIKKHPQMGFELIRRMPVFSILPAHVAFQHHERQDGTGYPRGLIGANDVSRSLTDRMNPRRMLLIAELAAVADVYSALTSDRPYRPSLPLDKAATIMTDIAGDHLNAEVVAMLMRTIPMFPVGHWIEILSGKYRGYRGVVTAISADTLHQPTVRLLLDDRGDRVSAPVELDLRARDDVRIRGLPPGEAPFDIPMALAH
ncbi:MAG: HD-GYP domain-containing protein [Chloroflexi bacterium]|nr:HD-GYP domain-containing protein [Chloroflexota bacterium]